MFHNDTEIQFPQKGVGKMMENCDSQWWNKEEHKISEKRERTKAIDSEYFYTELSKIEEALDNLTQFLRKYVRE
jgi:hypothetical protein